MCTVVPPFLQVATRVFLALVCIVELDRMLELRTGAVSAPSAVCALSGSCLIWSLLRLNDLQGCR